LKKSRSGKKSDGADEHHKPYVFYKLERIRRARKRRRQRAAEKTAEYERGYKHARRAERNALYFYPAERVARNDDDRNGKYKKHNALNGKQAAEQAHFD
jgi:hypothetical protein